MTVDTSVILASQSPSRRELFSRLGIPFDVEPQDIDETPLSNEKPHPYVRRVALEKALSAQRKSPKSLIISADTVVYKNHAFFQKPRNPQEAHQTLQRLSGARHRIFTGLCVLHEDRQCIKTIVTRVTFRRLQPEVIQRYVDQKHYQGFAGGYSIDGPALAFIKRVNGSISSIMGLPLSELCNILTSFGIKHDL